MKNKIERKIVEYLDGQLTPEERTTFEKEIESSSDLSTMVSSYKDLFSDFKETKLTEINRQYFDNILPEFHNQVKGRYSEFPSLAGAFASFIIVAVISWFAASNIFNDSQQTDSENNLLTEEEMFQAGDFTLNEMGNFILSDSVFTSMLTTELNLNEDENLFLAADEYEITFIDEELSAEDADIIYAHLIEKNFFNGEE